MMVKDNRIKIIQLFDSYSNFYQPYIPPVIESLKKMNSLKIAVNAFNGKSDGNVVVFSSYYRRKFKEKFYELTHRVQHKLNYAEIYFLQKNIDIVHIQHSYLFPKVLGLLSLPTNRRPKIIITLRGGDTYVKPWVQKKWADFYSNYGNKVDAFITMSEHQKKYLHAKWGIDKAKIHVIPISFGSRFNSSPKKPTTTKIKIVSIFRMCWEKNIDGNLRVIKYLHEKGLPVEYNIYGDGPDTGQLLYLIDKYNLNNCVKYHGKVTNSLLKEQISNYDFILQLSHSEAFPTSVLEAQSLGIPAIVSDSGGLPEAIIPNKTGFCVDANDCLKAAEHIESMWKKPELYKSFSAEAIKFSQSNFATENEVERLTNLYLKLS
jgi:glycosyltransferase involved in cell wall biosynthesis